MVKVGVHVSISGSIDRAVDRATARGCDTFQIFSRNPRGWKVKDLSESSVYSFIDKLKSSGIYPPVDHMPYLPNLASFKEETYTKSVEALEVELIRCEILGIPYLVTHLGSHTGGGKEDGFKRVVDAIDAALSSVDNDVILLLETTAGTKNSMGGDFEDIGRIIEDLGSPDRLGVCFDTCHAFEAGYEVRTLDGFAETMKQFESKIGLDLLKVVHLNDSKGGLNSHLDRHEHIGMGKIGEDGFRVILGHDAIRKLPLILETPVDSRRDDVENIRIVRELAQNGR